MANQNQQSTEQSIFEPLPKLDPATGLYICNYCQTPGCPGVFNRLACNERSSVMRDEPQPWLPWHIGERVSFAFPTETVRYEGLIRTHDSPAQYGIHVYAKSRGTFIPHELYLIEVPWILGLLAEPELDEAVAQRIIDSPEIRLVYDQQGVRYRLARRDENGVGHVDILAQRWPEVPGEEMPTQTGTITGLISAERLLFALQMALPQLRATIEGAQR